MPIPCSSCVQNAISAPPGRLNMGGGWAVRRGAQAHPAMGGPSPKVLKRVPLPVQLPEHNTLPSPTNRSSVFHESVFCEFHCRLYTGSNWSSAQFVDLWIFSSIDPLSMMGMYVTLNPAILQKLSGKCNNSNEILQDVGRIHHNNLKTYIFGRYYYMV